MDLVLFKLLLLYVLTAITAAVTVFVLGEFGYFDGMRLEGAILTGMTGFMVSLIPSYMIVFRSGDEIEEIEEISGG